MPKIEKQLSQLNNMKGVVVVPVNSRAINRVFTRRVLNDLLLTGKNDVFHTVVQRYINDPESKTHGEIISEIYMHLSKENRNEYYYLNTLLNKLLVGRHNVNTTTALSQVRIGHHIADFVMINGTGKVYEIKSDLDNFYRLQNQLNDYFRAFSYVSVLVSINELEKIERLLSQFGEMGDAVGIYTLSQRDTIFSKAHGRKPKTFEEYLDHTCIFKLLRKQEYTHLLLSYFGDIPQVTPVFYFKACLEKFVQIPISTAQDLAFRELKNRNTITKLEFEQIKPELKSVVYFSKLSKTLLALEHLLQARYRG